MFENSKDQEMFEKYFPPNPSNTVNDTPRPQQTAVCSHHHCCAPTPVVQCYSRCQGLPHPVPDIAVLVRELSDKVVQLSGDTATIKSVINNLVRSGPIEAQHQVSPPQPELPATVETSPPSPTDLPLSPDIIVIDASQAQVTPPQAVHEEQSEHVDDESMISDSNTIDEFVFEQQEEDLNCKALTNQSR